MSPDNTSGTEEPSTPSLRPGTTTLAASVGRAEQREQFDRYLAERHDGLVRYAQGLCRDHHLAQDLVQDAALASWRLIKAGKRTVGELHNGYMNVAVRNAYFTYLRKQKAERRRDDKVGSSPEHSLEGDPGERWMDDDGETARIRALLPQRHWEILALTADGFSAAEIAQRLGLAQGTVHNYLSTARGLIKKALA